MSKIDPIPKKRTLSNKASQGISQALLKSFRLTISPNAFHYSTLFKVTRFSKVVENHLKGVPFRIEVEKGVRLDLDTLSEILQINGLMVPVGTLQIIMDESDSADISPMLPPKIEEGIMKLKGADLKRPITSVRKAISESLKAKAEEAARIEEIRDLSIPKIGVELTKRDLALLTKFDLLSFDPSDPAHNYHYAIIRALFSPIQYDGLKHYRSKYIYDILHKIGFTITDTDKIIFEGSVLVGDISFDLGTRRDVDRVKVITSDYRERSFTASIDKEPAYGADLTHSEEEFQTLRAIEKRTLVVQRLYGLYVEQLKDWPGFHRAVIFKEYLEGLSTGLIYENLSEELKGAVVEKTGEMLGKHYKETESVPADMNNLNVIVNETEEEGITCRVCDVSSTERDPYKIANQIFPAIAEDYPGKTDELLRGFASGSGKMGVQVVARLVNHPKLWSSARKLVPGLMPPVGPNVLGPKLKK